jgi:hypothetical protein
LAGWQLSGMPFDLRAAWQNGACGRSHGFQRQGTQSAKCADKGSVRKRIFIGLAVLAVVGVGGYVLSLPRKGTVEYHKREYFRVRDGTKIGNTARWVFGKIGLRTSDDTERIERANGHYAALMRLGYLREQVFVVSNRPAEDAADALWFTFSKAFTNEVWGMGQMSDVGTNTITVIAPTEEMAQWEQAIRLADVPPEK